MATLKNEPISEKYPVCNSPLPLSTLAIAHAFFQKMAQKSPPIFITFSDTY